MNNIEFIEPCHVKDYDVTIYLGNGDRMITMRTAKGDSIHRPFIWKENGVGVFLFRDGVISDADLCSRWLKKNLYPFMPEMPEVLFAVESYLTPYEAETLTEAVQSFRPTKVHFVEIMSALSYDMSSHVHLPRTYLLLNSNPGLTQLALMSGRKTEAFASMKFDLPWIIRKEADPGSPCFGEDLLQMDNRYRSLMRKLAEEGSYENWDAAVAAMLKHACGIIRTLYSEIRQPVETDLGKNYAGPSLIVVGEYACLMGKAAACMGIEANVPEG